MTLLRHRGPGGLLTALALLMAPGLSAGPQPEVPTESDPEVVRLLPPGYPLSRVQVQARRYPWSAIGRITIDGGGHSCTGTLIGERHALTAAHCVWPVRSRPRELHFLAGFQRDSWVAHSRGRRLYLPQRFGGGPPSPATFAVDWAVIELEEPIGRQAGYLAWTDLQPSTPAADGTAEPRIAVSGYRGDRLFVQTVDHSCRLAGFSSDARLLLHLCPVTRGDSGGPVLLTSGSGDYAVAAIEVGLIGRPAERYPGLIDTDAQRVGVAVPVTTVRRALQGAKLGIGEQGSAPVEPAEQ